MIDSFGGRKLVSLQTVTDLKPIDGCSMIELAVVMGWKCIVKKGEFQVGDVGVYFEIDSKLPNEPWCAFMEKHSWRVKTLKMRGVISQGLLIPVSLVPYDLSEKCEGDDLTDIFKVEKWVSNSEFHLYSRQGGNFPFFIEKTDEERIQSNKRLIANCLMRHLYITEKLDGTSYTAFSVKDERYGGPKFGLCTRNFEIREDDGVRWQLADKLGLRKLSDLGKNIAVQGEMIGPKVQKNKYGRSEMELYLYSVYDIDEQKYLGLNALREISDFLGVKTVPILDSFVVNDDVMETLTVDKLVEMSSGKSSLADIQREGIVVRTLDDPRISFKVINPEFLLKYDE